MLPRQHQARLTAAAGILLLGQLALLAWVYHLPLPPPFEAAVASPAPVGLHGDPPAADNDARAVAILDALLERRVIAAAARRGVPPELPDPALRAAAQAAPDPNGPAVAALIEAYGARLAALGETLDATSSPVSAAPPERPDPAAERPGGSTPPASPGR